MHPVLDHCGEPECMLMPSIAAYPIHLFSWSLCYIWQVARPAPRNESRNESRWSSHAIMFSPMQDTKQAASGICHEGPIPGLSHLSLPKDRAPIQILPMCDPIMLSVALPRVSRTRQRCLGDHTSNAVPYRLTTLLAFRVMKP